MKKIEATEFKENCLDLLDNLDADGLIITQDGTPVASVLPFALGGVRRSGMSDADLIGSLRGKISIKGDIFTTGCHWKTASGDD